MEELKFTLADLESKFQTFKIKAAEVDKLKDEIDLINKIHESKLTELENALSKSNQDLGITKDKYAVSKEDNNVLIKLNNQLKIDMQKQNEMQEYAFNNLNSKYNKLDTYIHQIKQYEVHHTEIKRKITDTNQENVKLRDKNKNDLMN